MNDTVTLRPDWLPPADRLEFHHGVWRSRTMEAVSYPANANDVYLALEESSYWFRHRVACVRAAFSLFPPQGDFYDIGGGNGYICGALESAGYPTVLVEPGPGAENARRRGLPRVIQSTLQASGFRPDALPAVGVFDVLEHIHDDGAFLGDLHRLIAPGGRLYCTVPALGWLWSDEDEHAGHFRRYKESALVARLRAAGFIVEFCTPIFSWLVAPLFLRRTLPSLLRRRRRDRPANPAREHVLPRGVAAIVDRVHAHEVGNIRAGRALPVGSSLLAVARVQK